jgi:hypothetical protein
VSLSVTTRFEQPKSRHAFAILLSGVVLTCAGRRSGTAKQVPGLNLWMSRSPRGSNLCILRDEGISINLEEFGPGVCVADFDRDGWQDIYFVNGRERYEPGSSVKNALYHNNGDGTFTNVTKSANIRQPEGKNPSVGVSDYDNDGWPDVFVANARTGTCTRKSSRFPPRHTTNNTIHYSTMRRTKSLWRLRRPQVLAACQREPGGVLRSATSKATSSLTWL